jgi:hypothetical protein
MTLLPVAAAHALPCIAEERRWLIEGLWSDQAVGIVGGEPKCCKSFLALDMAVAVASGMPCLRRFRPVQTGRVLLFAAEDALHVVRARLDGISRAAGVRLADLDIQVITAPTVRLDLTDDARRLTDTIAALRPVLLVLDPFVRLHRIDENASAEVAPLLASLRDLQRRFELAVVVVHHARKGAARVRDGQALRGSSEFHAWGDSNLYLRRHGDQLTLAVEHRAAPSRAGIPLALRTDDAAAVALEVLEVTPPVATAAATAPSSATDKVEQALAEAAAPVALAELRRSCRMRMSSLCEILTVLTRAGRVRKTPAGYELAAR